MPGGAASGYDFVKVAKPAGEVEVKFEAVSYADLMAEQAQKEQVNQDRKSDNGDDKVKDKKIAAVVASRTVDQTSIFSKSYSKWNPSKGVLMSAMIVAPTAEKTLVVDARAGKGKEGIDLAGFALLDVVLTVVPCICDN